MKPETRRSHDAGVWDATVSDAAGGKPLALFRCTQMILYPREGG